MDKELSDIPKALKAHERSLTALREVQAEQGKTLADHTERLTRIEDRLGNVEGRLGSVEEGLTTVKVGVHATLDLLDTNLAKRSLASRVAARLTRHRDAA